jgi:hypothetical protein
MAAGTILALTAGAAKVAGAAAQGIAARRAADAIFTDADAAELARLQRLKAQGDLGLSAREKSGMLAQSQGQIAQSQAELQQNALQAQAAQAALGGPITGRDVFLREQVAQAEKARAQGEAGRTMAEVGEARRKEQLARLAQLRTQRAQESAAKRAATMQTIGSVLGTAGDIGLQAAFARPDVGPQAPGPEALPPRSNPYSGRI